MKDCGSRSFRKDAWLALGLFLLSLSLFALKWPFSLAGPTEAGAQRVLAGEIPYRDFWTMYAPGSFYLHALFLKVFGSHVLVEVIAGSVIAAAAVSSCYLLVSGWLQRTDAALACAVLFFAAHFAKLYHLTLGPYPPAILLILLTFISIARYYRRGRLHDLFAAGLLSGLTIVFKHDVAGYTGIAITAGLVAWHFGGGAILTDRRRSLLRMLAVYAAGAMLVSLPVASYFAIKAGPDMWQDLIVFPAMDFRYARSEAYPSLLPVGLYHPWKLRMAFNVFGYLTFLLPFLITLSAALVIAAACLKRYQLHVAFGITFVLAWLFHFTSAHVQINTNFISMTLYSSMLGAMLYDLVLRRAGPATSRIFKAICALLVIGWFVAIVAEPARNRFRDWRQKVVVLELPRVAGMRVTPSRYRELRFLADYVNRNISAEQTFFSGLHRHDATIIGASGLYFILGRMNPTRHDQLHPGVVDRADIQREIINDLEDEAVSSLILKHMFRDDWLDKIKVRRRLHLPESGATVLDEYIRQEFYKVDSYGSYEIWRRLPALNQQDDTGRP